jgi:hypothetical protein
MLPECKTKDEDDGIAQWTKFKNAILSWRVEHMKLFCSTEGLKVVSARELRAELDRLKNIIASHTGNGRNFSKGEFGLLFSKIRKIAEQGEYRASDLAVDKHKDQE